MPARCFFFLGSTPTLSLAELTAVLPAQTAVNLCRPDVADTSLESPEEAQTVFRRLGGSTKVAAWRETIALTDASQVEEKLLDLIGQNPQVPFAVAEHGRDHLPKFDPMDLKRKLQERGLSVRFVEGPRAGLSAAILIHRKVRELHVIQTPEGIYFAETLASQDIDDWTQRDRGKPYADRRKGMLPPKVARMMANIGIGAWLSLVTGEKTTQAPYLYDPFCGSGTVLMESWWLGAQVVGSDVDENASTGSQSNLEWFRELYHLQGEAKVFLSDATHVKPGQLGKPVDIIVTEPFLGKQTPNPAALPNLYRGLEKLYLGCFRNWASLLDSPSVVVMVWPVTEVVGKRFSLESLIDKLANLGYTPMSEPVMYARPEAIMQRQIWTFEFTKPIKA